MDDSSAIRPGQGFFSKTGKLKSEQELSSEIESTKKTKSAVAEPSQESDFTAQNVSNAIGAERNRFREQANQVIAAVNVNEGNAQRAQDVVRQEIKVANELKKALKEQDENAAAKNREKLNELLEERKALAQGIKADNDGQIEVLRKNLNFGNSQRGIVEVKPVEFKDSAVGTSDLKSVADVDKFIAGLKAENTSLRADREDFKETRQVVKSALEEVEQETAKIIDNSVRSVDEATRLANKIASEVRSGSQAALSNVTAVNVQRLLTG